jgi:hypothetical protein
MAEAQATTLGDRFERAIERHADTAGEIACGGDEKPHNLRRNVIWLAITCVSLYFVFPYWLPLPFGVLGVAIAPRHPVKRLTPTLRFAPCSRISSSS